MSGSGKYLALNINCKSAKTPELSRLLSKLGSELGLVCTSVKLLRLMCCQVPRSSQPHKIHLSICHPARPCKPITPHFLSGLLRFCQGVFLSYFSKSSKVSLVSSVGFLLKPNGTPLQYSCLENPMDGGAWKAAVHGVARSRTRLSGFTFTFHFHALEKEMATTPVFLPGESQGRGSLVGCRLWGCRESDTTEAT